MVNFLLIAICISGGFLLKKYRILPSDAHKGINIWIIYLALPAVCLKYIPTIKWSNDLLLPALMPVVVWVGSWLTFKVYSLIKHISPTTRAALTLVCGLGNTSFLGFPLIQAYYGEQALNIAVISDQISFALLATVGAITAMNASKNEALSIPALGKKLVQFPPFLAFIAALILPLFFNLAPLEPLLQKIAVTLVPLALFSVGMQLGFSGWRNEIGFLSIGLGYKLIIAPALILAFVFAFGLRGLIPQISVFEASMAPMITAGVLADQYNLNSKLANLVIGVGIVASFLTTGLWWLVLQYFA